MNHDPTNEYAELANLHDELEEARRELTAQAFEIAEYIEEMEDEIDRLIFTTTGLSWCSVCGYEAASRSEVAHMEHCRLGRWAKLIEKSKAK